jgi:hypothetical protein
MTKSIRQEPFDFTTVKENAFEIIGSELFGRRKRPLKRPY